MRSEEYRIGGLVLRGWGEANGDFPGDDPCGRSGAFLGKIRGGGSYSSSAGVGRLALSATSGDVSPHQ